MTMRIEPVRLGPEQGLPPVESFNRGVSIDPSLRDACFAHGPARENLEQLFNGALCVTTGQQPGLFTGPLYTVNKALAAAALARRCRELSGRDVVPVFWVAGDDHDFVESNHCDLLDRKGELVRLHLPDRDPEAPLTPMYKQVLGEDIEAVRAQLADVLPESEFAGRWLDLVGKHYQPDATVADAFGGMVAELLGEFGVVVFRPSHREVKTVAAPVIRTALENAAGLTEGLARWSADLEGKGEDAPVAVKDGESLVMLEASLGRDRLLYNGDGFTTRRSGETFSRDDVQSILADTPERLSPNVLLRPVVEAALLPTIAYVAGPGERKYLRQTPPIYDAVEVKPQAVVTRWGGRIVEARVDKVMQKYGIGYEDLQLPEGQLEGQLASDDMPPEVSQALDALKACLEGNYAQVVDVATELDPTIKKPVEAALHRSLKEMNSVEKRIVGLLKQRNATLIRQIHGARTALFPSGKEQERVLNVLHFLSRYGDDALHALWAACDDWSSAFTGDSAG